MHHCISHTHEKPRLTLFDSTFPSLLTQLYYIVPKVIISHVRNYIRRKLMPSWFDSQLCLLQVGICNLSSKSYQWHVLMLLWMQNPAILKAGIYHPCKYCPPSFFHSNWNSITVYILSVPPIGVLFSWITFGCSIVIFFLSLADHREDFFVGYGVDMFDAIVTGALSFHLTTEILFSESYMTSMVPRTSVLICFSEFREIFLAIFYLL